MCNLYFLNRPKQSAGFPLLPKPRPPLLQIILQISFQPPRTEITEEVFENLLLYLVYSNFNNSLSYSIYYFLFVFKNYEKKLRKIMEYLYLFINYFLINLGNC